MSSMTIKYEWEGRKYDVAHGEPFDRGSADSYYHRRFDPHWWPEGTMKGDRVEKEDMSEEEIQAYTDGFDYNEAEGDKKDWG